VTFAADREDSGVSAQRAETGTRPTDRSARSTPVAESGVGRGYVRVVGVVIVASMTVLAMTFAVYCLVAVWPTSASTGTSPSEVAGIKLVLDEEQRLFVVVAIAGFLGGLVHGARSLYDYVGNRILRRSWLLMYVLLPFIGGSLAILFYVILRGGLVTGTAAQVNFFGFAAVSALVGLFSPEAAEKLKQIFSTLLAPVPPGRDRLTEGHDAVVYGIEPDFGRVGSMVTIRGRNLADATAVMFDRAPAVAVVKSDTEVTAVVPVGAASGPIRLVVGESIVSVPEEFRVEQ
jgi:IPT/TIG domain